MNDDYRYSDQPYVGEVLRLARTYAGKRGAFNLVVEHDDWCPVLSKSGYCVCRPVVRRPNRAERRKIKKSSSKQSQP